LEAIEDVDVGALETASRGDLVEGGTARAAVDMGAVPGGLDGVSKDPATCLILLRTYEVSGDRESSAQAEDAEDGDKEQHDCGDFGGEGHVALYDGWIVGVGG
jgi:hypothetical protein